MNLSYYYEKGYDAANEDARAGSLPATVDALDEGALMTHLGLDDGGAETRAILATGDADDVNAARDAVLDGYRARVQDYSTLRCPNCGRDRTHRPPEYYVYSSEDSRFEEWADNSGDTREQREVFAASAARDAGWPSWVMTREIRCCGNNGGAVLSRAVEHAATTAGEG